MKGRRPTPTPLKIVRGNPGKRPLRMDEFRPERDIPPCPRHLNGESRKEWHRITKELDRYGMISAVDRGALAMLCTQWGRYVEAEMMIEKAAQANPGGSGLFVKSPNNFPIQSPWLAVSNKAMEMYKALCTEFGLTPASRVRAAPMTSQAQLFSVDEAPPGAPASFGTFK